MARNGYDFPVLLDTENVASTAYGVSGLPSTFVIGRNGRIVWNCRLYCLNSALDLAQRDDPQERGRLGSEL
jgi:hypothetical protein